MIALNVQQYRNRARDFLEGMKFLQGNLSASGYSSALLGIHSAISYGDALRVGMGSKNLSSEDHRRAVADLRSLLVSRKFEKQQGVDRLGRLLSKKSRIAYASEATREDEIKQIVQQAERFAAWAEDAGEMLKIEGW